MVKYNIVLLKDEEPPIGKFVTMIDKNNNHLIYCKNTFGGYSLRDTVNFDSNLPDVELIAWFKEDERLNEAPFTQEEIDNINEFQENLNFHSLTCSNRYGECITLGNKLNAQPNGLTCNCGRYTQKHVLKAIATKTI